MSDRGRERGSATIWVVACCALLLVVGSVAALRAAAVVARHRVEGAADLAALAAAGRIGLDGAACSAAARIAAANRVRLRSCKLELAANARSGTVTVSVQTTVRMPLAGTQQVVASARAGRLPAPLSAHDRSSAGRQPLARQPAGREPGG